MALHDNTEKMEHALEFAAREYSKHSGPQSDERERRTFGRDLHVAALRFARAYYAEARELGLIPEYERATAGSTECGSHWMSWRCSKPAGHADECSDSGGFTTWTRASQS